MKLFKKLFCLHKWKKHAESSGRRTYTTGMFIDYTRDVLICEHCGKIKTIEY